MRLFSRLYPIESKLYPIEFRGKRCLGGLRRVEAKPIKERRRLVAGQPRPSGWRFIPDSLAQPAGRRDVRPSLGFRRRWCGWFQRFKDQGGAASSCPATSAGGYGSACRAAEGSPSLSGILRLSQAKPIKEGRRLVAGQPRPLGWRFVPDSLAQPAGRRDVRPSLSGRLRLGLIYTYTVFCLSLSVHAAEIPADQLEFFENKIRPVLAQECYECHSSHGIQKAGLVLDYRDGLLEGGDGGPAIEPGNAEYSLLMDALLHIDGLEMPKAGVMLEKEIIDDFRKWIDMGAPDPRDHPPTEEELAADDSWEITFKNRQKWWSFQPIEEPLIPAAEGEVIDRFVAVQLGDLSPAAPAEPRVLARRLHYALTGLPATPEQLDAFETAAASDRQAATDALIDELLASPHYGERWARHWMDWVRYAESHGSEGDPRIDGAHHYRDYLIRALNADIPYDQLLREHIAGDLLETPRVNDELALNESVLGAIHWRMCFHGFAPTDALDEKVRFTDDQINTFTKAFQGLTVSCARCHNHKFDAISQADYYALFGILGSTRPGRKLTDLPDALEKNKAELSELKPAIRQAVATDWLASLDQMQAALLNKENWKQGKNAGSIYHPFHLLHKDKQLTPGQALQRVVDTAKNNIRAIDAKVEFDTSDEAGWYRYGNGVQQAASGDFAIHAEGDLAIDHIAPAGLYSGLLSTKHAGRVTSTEFSPNGEMTLMLLVNGGGQAMNRTVVQNYPRRGTVFPIERMGPKKDAQRSQWHWKTYDLSYWDGDSIHIELSTARDSAVEMDKTDRSWFGIRGGILAAKGTPIPSNPMLEMWLALDGQPAPDSAESLAAAIVSVARDSIENWRAGEISDPQVMLLDHLVGEQLLPNQLSSLGQAADLIAKYRKLEAEIAVPTRIPGLDEWVGTDNPLYDRGDHKKPLEPVSRRFLEAVDATPYESPTSGRLELAADMLRADNPFTRRVIVNRVWTHLFGNGIVGSVDNFGRLGEKPSHPELLDYLASRFDSEMDWSIKSLIREIVSSATWQQSSTASAAASESDPENRLLSHYPVRRLEAEAIRDKLFAVSGLLDERLYGPAVNGGTPRRSVYVEVIRNRLDPFLGVFDAPVPFSTTGKRPVTNVPAQSLTMLNDRVMYRYAEAFANRFRDVQGDEARIAAMWSQALGRPASEQEVAAGSGFLQSLRSGQAGLQADIASLQEKIDQLQAQNRDRLAPVRDRLVAALPEQPEPLDPMKLGAIASWDFDSDADLGGRLTGNAKVEDGSLVLDGNSSFFADPLDVDLREKTLEALVTLDNLRQKSGGVLSVQTVDGHTFDGIVYAERKSGEWLAGSNHHRRTQDFGGDPEQTATDAPVHLVVAYDADGTIRAYRDGEPYGQPYTKGEPIHYQKGKSQIVIGLRHGTGNGGNRNIAGLIHHARVYPTALAADTIAALAGGRAGVTRQDVIDALSDIERTQYHETEASIETLSAELAALQREGQPLGENAVWQSFAHSLFNLKEFIYIY